MARADAIIGNPPFHGSQNIRKVMGDDYAEWLKRTYGVGLKDYCAYWFRRAHDHLPDAGRAGLVGTNSISQNRARGVSLNYVVGDDLTEDPGQRPRRWIIDFALRSLEEAMHWPEALKFVRERVKPQRDRNRREAYRRSWWRFAESRPGMRRAVASLAQYIAGNAQGKRFLFTWQDADVCPSNLVNVFAYDDDYTMGVLTSAVHGVWALAQSSTLEDRPRYTPTSAFEPSRSRSRPGSSALGSAHYRRRSSPAGRQSASSATSA